MLGLCSKKLSDRVAAGEKWDNQFDLVFSKQMGKPLSGRNVTRVLHQMLEKAGLKRIRFYDTRHTCASLLIAQGVHPRVVMEILGHSQISITMNTYGHVMPSSQKEAADKLNDLLQ